MNNYKSYIEDKNIQQIKDFMPPADKQSIIFVDKNTGKIVSDNDLRKSLNKNKTVNNLAPNGVNGKRNNKMTKSNVIGKQGKYTLIMREGAVEPYVIANGYDKKTDTWKSGTYFNSMSQAMNELKAKNAEKKAFKKGFKLGFKKARQK